MRHVNDQRMVGWPALCRKNAGHGCGVFRIGPEAVDPRVRQFIGKNRQFRNAAPAFIGVSARIF
jgi:hypothetical protein